MSDITTLRRPAPHDVIGMEDAGVRLGITGRWVRVLCDRYEIAVNKENKRFHYLTGRHYVMLVEAWCEDTGHIVDWEH